MKITYINLFVLITILSSCVGQKSDNNSADVKNISITRAGLSSSEFQNVKAVLVKG